MPTNKSLGQHWLKDRAILAAIADAANLNTDDTVLEIGPGLGTLTSELLRRAGRVVAVEYDEELARKLPAQFPGKNLEVVHSDILSYDFSSLPSDFVIVGNIPYYITNKIVRKASEGPYRPKTCVLLVQREVAERLAATPGDMSILAVSAQIFFEISLGPVVGAASFTPPPKVDSQVVIMQRRDSPMVSDESLAVFFRVVKAGFSAKRKKLRSSLSGGLGISKPDAEKMLLAAEISPDSRAEDLSIGDWQRLVKYLV